MNKTILATTAVLAALTLAACTEEAKASGLTVYGSIEQGVSVTGGVTDAVQGDNYIGFDAKESFGESGNGAFAKIEMAFDSEVNGLTNREAYVGLDLNGVKVQTGRMKNLEKSFVAGAVDIFEGESFSTTGAARVSNASALVIEGDVATVGASVITDGAAGQSGADAYEVAAKTTFGPLSVAGVYTKDNVTETITKRVSTVSEFAGVTLGGAYDIDTEAKIATASIDLGNNTLRGGVDLDADNNIGKKVVEAQHNFSKNTSAYVNVSKEDGQDQNVLVAMRMKF
jgi:predicted porin